MLDFSDISPHALRNYSSEELEKLAGQILGLQQEDRKENQILFYRPASKKAEAVHRSKAHVVGVGGGNRSSKTETVLAEIAALATGRFPIDLRDVFADKFRGPLNIRIVCESLTTVMHPILLPKLKWWIWTGVDEPGGEKGHYGWIPKSCLVDGQWEKSWSEKLRTLRVLCRDPETDKVLGESQLQIMCLRGDQRVKMSDGTWLPISEIAPGQFVAKPGGLDRSTVAVKRVFENGIAPLYRVRCKGGREIIATATHRHPVAVGKRVWKNKTTADLELGDVILTEPLVGAGGQDMPLPEWLLGWTAIAIGDGYIKGRDYSFTASNPGRVLSDLPPLPPETRLVKMPSKSREYRIWRQGPRRDNPIVVVLKDFGLWGRGSGDKFVPDAIFRQPRRQVAYFLRHLWNTDGTVYRPGRQAMYSSISRRLAYDVKYLLWNLGIYACISNVTSKCGFTGKLVPHYHVIVSGRSFDRFCAAVNGEDFEAVPSRPTGTHGKILSIEPVDPAPTFCIEVDDPDHLFVADGLATHNSHDQDPSDFASGTFHIVMLDEPPPIGIWKESKARVLDVKGRILLAMTWPDDPSIPVDWIYDEVYEKGLPGPNKDPLIDWFELWSTDNRHLDQKVFADMTKNWSETDRQVRILGQPIRFSNRIHPLFTDRPQTWCFTCGKPVVPDDGKCGGCGGEDLTGFCHVTDIQPERTWPTVWLLDPHPRKPHMFAWVQVDPSDDLWTVAEGKLDGDPTDVKTMVDDIEGAMGLDLKLRLMDPNMGRSPASAKVREMTWQDEFEEAGLVCDLADDSDVGRSRLNEFLKPDAHTYRPRFHISTACPDAISQTKRYSWDDHRQSLGKDLKQKPKAKYDDYPTLFKYLMNWSPTFYGLKTGPQIYRAVGRRRGY